MKVTTLQYSNLYSINPIKWRQTDAFIFVVFVGLLRDEDFEQASKQVMNGLNYREIQYHHINASEKSSFEAYIKDKGRFESMIQGVNSKGLEVSEGLILELFDTGESQEVKRVRAKLCKPGLFFIYEIGDLTSPLR